MIPMTMNPLPPQAYTKDTLTKAYMWLLNQNPSIKEIATTPDVLVTLFLKAQRNGDESLDTPSIQNFKNELKSLASMMGDLGPGPAQMSKPASVPSQPQNEAPPRHFHAQVDPAPKSAHQTSHQSAHHTPHQAPPSAASQQTVSSFMSQLDTKSQFMVNELREQLNLSSDTEVLRFLISLGYNKAKNLYS